MNCPKCSAPMNHHASKVIEPRNETEQRGLDPDLGGTVLEAYVCPHCGASASRLGEPPRSGS